MPLKQLGLVLGARLLAGQVIGIRAVGCASLSARRYYRVCHDLAGREECQQNKEGTEPEMDSGNNIEPRHGIIYDTASVQNLSGYMNKI